MSPPGVILEGRFVRCTWELPQCMGEAALGRCACPRWTWEQLREAELCSWRGLPQHASGVPKVQGRGDLYRALRSDGVADRTAYGIAYRPPLGDRGSNRRRMLRLLRW